MTSKLTQPQRALLEVAASGGVVSDASASRATLAALLKRGLLIESAGDGSAGYSITEAGRAAVSGIAEPAPQRGPTKAALLTSMLRRPEGATIAQMSEVTAWLPHSVRGFLAGTLKKKLGLDVASEKGESGRVYRIVAGAEA